MILNRLPRRKHSQLLNDPTLHIVAHHVPDERHGVLGHLRRRIRIERVPFRRKHRSHWLASRRYYWQNGDRRIDAGGVHVIGPTPIAINDHGSAASLE